MYVTEFGANEVDSRIIKVQMDGSSLTELYKANVKAPTAIAIDKKGQYTEINQTGKMVCYLAVNMKSLLD